MKAFALHLRLADAAARRCICQPCNVVTGFATVFNGDAVREAPILCGRVHHDQRGRYHEALRPHTKHANRQQRREPLRAAYAKRVAEHSEGETQHGS